MQPSHPKTFDSSNPVKTHGGSSFNGRNQSLIMQAESDYNDGKVNAMKTLNPAGLQQIVNGPKVPASHSMQNDDPYSGHSNANSFKGNANSRKS